MKGCCIRGHADQVEDDGVGHEIEMTGRREEGWMPDVLMIDGGLTSNMYPMYHIYIYSRMPRELIVT